MVYQATYYQAPINKWCTLSTCSVWWQFKRHNVLLEDPRMRDRLNPFIDATTDAFVTVVRYYHKCWLKCIINRALTDEKVVHLQNIKIIEVQEMVFHHVHEMIFRDHETNTLQGLLKYYMNFLNNYGWPPLMLGLATSGIFWKGKQDTPLDSSVDTSAIKVRLCMEVKLMVSK